MTVACGQVTEVIAKSSDAYEQAVEAKGSQDGDLLVLAGAYVSEIIVRHDGGFWQPPDKESHLAQPAHQHGTGRSARRRRRGDGPQVPGQRAGGLAVFTRVGPGQLTSSR